jgi:Recombinase
MTAGRTHETGVLRRPSQNTHFPSPSNGSTLISFDWRPIRYRNVIWILKNPFYAGVYAYGKSERRTTIVDGRAREASPRRGGNRRHENAGTRHTENGWPRMTGRLVDLPDVRDGSAIVRLDDRRTRVVGGCATELLSLRRTTITAKEDVK